MSVSSCPPESPQLTQHGETGDSMSEDVVTVYKEVFDDNSEPTDGGEENWEMFFDGID